MAAAAALALALQDSQLLAGGVVVHLQQQQLTLAVQLLAAQMVTDRMSSLQADAALPLPLRSRRAC